MSKGQYLLCLVILIVLLLPPCTIKIVLVYLGCISTKNPTLLVIFLDPQYVHDSYRKNCFAAVTFVMNGMNS